MKANDNDGLAAAANSEALEITPELYQLCICAWNNVPVDNASMQKYTDENFGKAGTDGWRRVATAVKSFLQSQSPSVDDAERKAAEKYFLMMCESMALDPDAACNPELRTIRALLSGTAKKVGE